MKTQFCWIWQYECAFDWPGFMNGLPGWLQAIGSLAGLGLTIFLYQQQIHQNRLDKAQAIKDKRDSQVNATMYFANMVDLMIIEVNKTLESSVTEKPALGLLGQRMIDLVDWSGRFEIDTFNEDEAVHFFRVRDAAHKVALWITLFEPAEILVRKQFISELANEIRDDIHALIFFD